MNPNRRWVAITFFVFGIVLYVLLSRFLLTVMGWIGIDEYDYALLGDKFTLTNLVGLIIGAGVTIYCYRHPVISQLSGEVVVELKKVTWPTFEETRGATIVVIITVFILAIFMFVFDLFWSKTMDFLYPTIQA